MPLSFGLRGRFVVRQHGVPWRFDRSGFGQLGQQPRLVRIEALGPGAVQPAQQLVEAMSQPLVGVLLFFQGVEQLMNQGV